MENRHDEVAFNYNELALAVELKCSKLENELDSFRDIVQSLNELNMLKPTAHGCILESLAELTRIKDELREFIVKNPQGSNATAAPTVDVLRHLKSRPSEKLYISPGGSETSGTVSMGTEGSITPV